MKEEAVRFVGGGSSLEGRLALPPGARRGAVVCHPHPQYGGDMDNPVQHDLRAVRTAVQQPKEFAGLRLVGFERELHALRTHVHLAGTPAG